MGGIFSWTYVPFLLSVAIGSVIYAWIYNNPGRSILVAGFLMHFAQNATLIFLGGIFDSLAMPPAYRMVMLVETVLAAALIVFQYDSRTPIRQPG